MSQKKEEPALVAHELLRDITARASGTSHNIGPGNNGIGLGGNNDVPHNTR